MFGKKPRLNPLESRKQLLIAESELNRAQMVQEWQAMADGVRSVADRARTISSIASTAASLIAGLASFRRNKSAPAPKNLPGADPSQRRRTDFHRLAGVPLTRVGIGTEFNS
jgi:hypothetical protein